MSDARTTVLEGRRIAAGARGRAWLARLLGVERTGGKHLVKAAAWVADHVEIAVQTGPNSEIVFLIEPPGTAEAPFVSVPGLVMRYRGKDLPPQLAAWIRAAALTRLAPLTIAQIADALHDDPELGDARQPFPSSATPHPAHQLDTWGAEDAWADFLARGEIARGQLDSIDPSKLFRFVQHCDNECLEVNPYGVVPLVFLVDYPWLDRGRTVGETPKSHVPIADDPAGAPAALGEMMTTDLDERDVIFGNPGKVRAILEQATSVEDPQKRILFFSNTCVPAVTGEDVESVVREFQRKSTTPLVYLTVTPKAMNDVFRDLLVTKRRKIEDAAPAADPCAVNLIGFASDRATAELSELLASFGVRVNTQIFPDLDLPRLERLPGASLNVFRPNQVWAHYYEQLCDGSRTAQVSPPAPVGPAGTRRWVKAVIEGLGMSFDAAIFEAAAARQQAQWEIASSRTGNCRLGLVVRVGELHHLTDPAQTWGFPLLEFAREAGFGVDLILQANDLRAGRVAADELARSIQPGPGWSLHVVQSFESLMERLEKSPCQAVLSHHFFDWRLSQCGKSRFSLQLLELGIAGGARSVERLTSLCANPFYGKYRRFLRRTTEGLRVPGGTT